MINVNDIIPNIPPFFSRVGIRREYGEVEGSEIRECDLETASITVNNEGLFGFLDELSDGDSADKNGAFNGNVPLGLFDEHGTAKYLDLLLDGECVNQCPENTDRDCTVVGVFCPVDIIVKDKNGNIVAETKDGEAYNYGDGDVLVLTSFVEETGDYQKYIIHSGNRAYSLDMNGTDIGLMDFAYCKLNWDGYDMCWYDDVALETGTWLQSQLYSEMDLDDVKLFLMEEGDKSEEITEGREIKHAEWDKNEKKKSVSHSISSSTGLSASTPKYSPRWQKDISGRWFITKTDGQIVKSAWLCDDVFSTGGKKSWFLFGADGFMIAANLVQDNTGNFYSFETNPDSPDYGKLRIKCGTYNYGGQQIYLEIEENDPASLGAIKNPEAIETLNKMFGLTVYPIGNKDVLYTSSF